MIDTATTAAAMVTLTPPDPDVALHVTTLLRALGGLCTLCDRPHLALGLCNMHYLRHHYKRAVEAEQLAINGKAA